MDKVGIITWHYYPNFGSALQCYALNHIISGLGYEVETINYHNPKFGKNDSMSNIVRGFIKRILGSIPLWFANERDEFFEAFKVDEQQAIKLQTHPAILYKESFLRRTYDMLPVFLRKIIAKVRRVK